MVDPLEACRRAYILAPGIRKEFVAWLESKGV
jgi:hypothetical protein